MFNFNYPSSIICQDAVERIKGLLYDFYDLLWVDPMSSYPWFTQVEGVNMLLETTNEELLAKEIVETVSKCIDDYNREKDSVSFELKTDIFMAVLEKLKTGVEYCI